MLFLYFKLIILFLLLSITTVFAEGDGGGGAGGGKCYCDKPIPNIKKTKAILNMHSKWVIDQSQGEQANFSKIDLVKLINVYKINSLIEFRNANFEWACINGIKNFNNWNWDSIFYESNFRYACLMGNKFDKATFEKTNLKNAHFDLSSLKGAKLLECNVSDTSFNGVDLAGAVYEVKPGTIPSLADIARAINLWQLTYESSPQSLVELRNALKIAGFREQERQLTYAIKHNHIKKAGRIERYFNYVFFELTCKWGMLPFRPLLIVAMMIPIFSLIYLIFLIKDSDDGIWRYWPPDRMKIVQTTNERELLKIRKGNSLFYALYFSLLSAFRIGWRDVNVGIWISRFQPREYSLQATGMARFISGLQSLISVYLLALSILTYFGRPFE